MGTTHSPSSFDDFAWYAQSVGIPRDVVEGEAADVSRPVLPATPCCTDAESASSHESRLGPIERQ